MEDIVDIHNQYVHGDMLIPFGCLICESCNRKEGSFNLDGSPLLVSELIARLEDHGWKKSYDKWYCRNCEPPLDKIQFNAFSSGRLILKTVSYQASSESQKVIYDPTRPYNGPFKYPTIVIPMSENPSQVKDE